MERRSTVIPDLHSLTPGHDGLTFKTIVNRQAIEITLKQVDSER